MIIHHLQSDVPLEVVSACANVGPDILEKHYDCWSEKTKTEQRHKFLRNI